MPEAAASDNLQYSIQASSSRADDRTRVLKNGETFAVFDHYGDIQPSGMGEQGIFHEGTRFLSRLEFHLYGERPMLLNSTVKEDNALLTVDLSNPALLHGGKVAVQSGALHIFRGKLLWNGSCCSHIRFTNYSSEPITVSFSLNVDADFADIFEVRGMKRARRGRRLADVVDETGFTMAYEGLDGVMRRTRINGFPNPNSLSPGVMGYEFQLAPKSSENFFITITCIIGDRQVARPLEYHDALGRVLHSLDHYNHQSCQIQTSHDPFNEWLGRSYTDLFMMVTQTDYGAYPFAGVPWFSTVFGRDGLITALETMWTNPNLAKGVLNTLAALQAREVNAAQDSQPGKILHEMRQGEMAALNEVPFGRYYGSVDSTALFVMLAAAYYEWTGDKDFIEAIWPQIDLAVHWMDHYGDADRDGFLEYQRMTPEGLAQQGWKDSQDSVMHADGTYANAPIALCEVQGYAYAAYRGAGRIAADLGQWEYSSALMRKAEALRVAFEKAFWCEDIRSYALALDGAKRPCRVQSSNAGHCLYTGIASPERAAVLARTLMSESMYSGWGIRTLATHEARYNPMSYHNGSIWPHDNALIAAGFARYGLMKDVHRVFSGLFDLSQEMDLHRLPELFCGFHRRPGEGPILYPVACAPQAWATASVYMLLQSCLHLQINGQSGRVSFHHPVLPQFLNEVYINNLQVGQGSVDLIFYRYEHDVGFSVTRKEGDVEVMVVK